MAQNRQDTEYEIWAKILVEARAWAASEGVTVTGPSWLSGLSVPNRRDTLIDKMQKTLAVIHAIAIS